MRLYIKGFMEDIIHFRIRSILSHPYHLLVLAILLVVGHNMFYALGTITDFALVGFLEITAFLLGLIAILFFFIALFKKNLYLFIAILIAICLWTYHRTGHLPFANLLNH